MLNCWTRDDFSYSSSNIIGKNTRFSAELAPHDKSERAKDPVLWLYLKIFVDI